MTEDSESPATFAGSLKAKRGVLLLVVSIGFVLAMLFYMEKTPELLHWPIRFLFFAAIGYLLFAIFRWVRSTKFEAKKVVFSLILAAFFYGALFLICMVFIKLMSAKDEELTTVKTNGLSEKARRAVNALLSGDSPSLYDVDIGWVPRPDYEWKMHKIGPQGIRGTKVYPESPVDPDKRILCIGDSFTFGYEVEDDQTYPHHAEQLLPGTEWINLGICGGGLTQSYLHYKKNGRKFGGKYVVIGFMTNNNKRTVNCFRGFVSPDDAITPLTKPFAKLNDGELTIEPNPYQEISDYEKLLADEAGELEKLYQQDYYTWSEQRASTNPVVRTLRYVWDRREGDRNLDLILNRPVTSYRKPKPGDDPYGRAIWHLESPGFLCNAGVFDRYYKDVIADGRVPLIVILPSAKDVEERAKGRTPKHAALLEYLDGKGYRYMDFLDSLEVHRKDRMTKKDLFGNTHLNGETNKLLAEEIIEALSLSGKGTENPATTN
jgi:hypothetical protein